MPYYAQLNDEMACVAVTESAQALAGPRLVPLKHLDESHLGRVYRPETGAFEAVPAPARVSVSRGEFLALLGDDLELSLTEMTVAGHPKYDPQIAAWHRVLSAREVVRLDSPLAKRGVAALVVKKVISQAQGDALLRGDA